MCAYTNADGDLLKNSSAKFSTDVINLKDQHLKNITFTLFIRTGSAFFNAVTHLLTRFQFSQNTYVINAFDGLYVVKVES